jgi:topoisomerase-4 subunit A
MGKEEQLLLGLRESEDMPEEQETEEIPESPEEIEQLDDDGDDGDDGGGGDGGDGGDDDAAAASEPSALRQMMSQYFMEYASYVIKDRAIPDIDDGLKPVQRRILYSLQEMDDGKYHKVANIVGNTMKYHPHGDMSIYNALVHVANKEFFIDRQGNFGNIFTGDVASAARYIECRLSLLAREVLFNKEVTEFVDTYDGRNAEPVVLPAKVPLLLLQGAEGIAVGMSTRVLPHNFKEVLKAQISILRKRKFAIYPDFLQGGSMDVSEYEDGAGRIRLRATIEIASEKKLVIREIPATTTTEGLIMTIEDAVNRGKLKISSINDYTAEAVEIEINLPRNIYADRTIQALYAYTDCQVSISCNCLVIQDNMPVELPVSDVLRHNTDRLVNTLRSELEIELQKLRDHYHERSLVQIFIENRIYKKIEKCETLEAVTAAVHKGLKPHVANFERPVTDDDVAKLLQIPIRRISLFDLNKNQEDLRRTLEQIAEIEHNLANIVPFTIDYLKDLIKRYGPQYKRRTAIEEIEVVDVRSIALSDVKVGIDKSNGYIGTEVKSDVVMNCTEFDRLVIIKPNGTYKVVPIPEKLYVGRVAYLGKSDKELVFSMIYKERKTRQCFAKRFMIDKYIMDREYSTVPKGCKVEKVSDRLGVVLRCQFEPVPRQKKKHADVKFDDIPVRSSSAKGYRVATKQIAKVLQLKRGAEQSASDADADVD